MEKKRAVKKKIVPASNPNYKPENEKPENRNMYKRKGDKRREIAPVLQDPKPDNGD